MKADLIVELGLGGRARRLIEGNNIQTHFLEFTGNPDQVGKTMESLRELSSTDSAMTDVQGGVDLISLGTNLQVKNNDGGFKIHTDPAMLEQLRNVPGFTPVIINIQPMTSLRLFLGLNE